MKHLFILNPFALCMKNKVEPTISNINAFFEAHKNIDYSIHVTRWARDATGYVRSFVLETDETVRIHSYGGAGLLSEIINGIVDLPNAQVAAYPMGCCNDFIRYFRDENRHLFTSIEKQVFSNIVSMDIIRCGNHYGISYGMVGIEAKVDKVGTEMFERTGIPLDFCVVWKAFSCGMQIKHKGQLYKVTLDGKTLDGRYNSFLVANGPCYGVDMNPAVDAHPNDGRLEIYTMNAMHPLRILISLPQYLSGNYKDFPDRYTHLNGQKITISSDETMYCSLDGETFLERFVEFEVIPQAISFVCPDEIDIGKLPRIYNRPEEGTIYDRQK